MEEYTQEQATFDVAASMDNIVICETIQAIAESDRTEEQAGDLFRSEGHLRLKMAVPLFVSTLSSDQKSRIEALNL
tara:strand:- start:504 stop:731 length:228 start_codon:yes stop_codon:yes gene_type:complete